MQESAITAERVGVIVLRAGDPIGESDFGGIGPAERSGGGGLIAAVDAHRVMGGRAAKPVSESLVIHVGVGAGIDDQFLGASPDDQAQCVRVAVPATLLRKGTGVVDNLQIPVCHNHNTGVGDHAVFVGE